jgi:DNA-binding IclR family transcriptional regulator
MVSITVQLNFDYALSFRFFFLWQLLTDTGARSQLAQLLEQTSLNAEKLHKALQILEQHDVIQLQDGYYSYKVELMRRWVAEQQSNNSVN